MKLQLHDSWQWEEADQPSAQEQLARRLLLCNAPIAGKNAPAAFLPKSLDPFGVGQASGAKFIANMHNMMFALEERSSAAAKTWRQVVVEQPLRSDENTSELQSLMRSSYAVFCLKKKKK